MLRINQIYCMDNIKGMKMLDDDCVDLTVTSPPYDDLRKYKEHPWNFEGVANELWRVTKAGGVVVWVIGDSTIDGSETCSSFKQALYFKSIGFNLHDTMIYSRGAQGGAKGSAYAYTQSFEYMFIFSKGRPKTTNLFKDRPNSTYQEGKNKRSSMRKPHGQTEWFETKMNPFSKRTNIWELRGGYMVGSPDKITFEHPASFPEALANDHIISWSNPKDLILDPFVGSGTTAKMAFLNQRNYIGFEVSLDYCCIANARLIKYMREAAIL